MLAIYFLMLCAFLLLLLFFAWFVIVHFVAVFTTQAPFVPIPKNLEYEIVKHLNLDESSVVYDLGCGDARVLVAASEKFPKSRFIGIEIAIWPYVLAKLKTRNLKNVIIKREDIFRTNISNATHIFLYLYPEVINKLITDIEQQCKKDTIIISCDFQLKNRVPVHVLTTNNTSSPTRGKKLFVYKV